MDLSYGVDQLQAIEWCDDIWDDMEKTTIINYCFQHTGILFRDVGASVVAQENNRVDCDEGIHDARTIILLPAILHIITNQRELYLGRIGWRNL
jgi:hypothetical protein